MVHFRFRDKFSLGIYLNPLIYVNVYPVKDVYAVTFDGKKRLQQTTLESEKEDPATLCISVSDGSPTLYERVTPIISAEAETTISNRNLKDAGLEKYMFGYTHKERCYYANKEKEEALLKAFDRLVDIAGLIVHKDYRK